MHAYPDPLTVSPGSLLPFAECRMQEFRPLLLPPSIPWPREVTSPHHLPWVTDDQLLLGSPVPCPFWRCLSPDRLSWQPITHQQSLLARFPSLRLGLGALAPDEGRIACRDRRRRSEGADVGHQGLRGHNSRGTISKVTTKLQPAHYQVQQPLKRPAAAGGGGTTGRLAKGGRHQGKQREEEEARWAGPGGPGLWPPNLGQKHTTSQGFPPTHPEGSHH